VSETIRSGVRFAPSPTGRFHLGNLRTAWISRQLALRLGEPWICRFEDIDQPRVLEGAMATQLEDMKTLGLVPDQLLIQTDFHERHFSLFQKARETGQVYPCFCSRKEILEALQGAASAPHQEPPIYNGQCRSLLKEPLTSYPASTHPTVAWRFVGEDPSGAQDFIIGRTNWGKTEREWLRTFVPAYHWACAIDDYDGGYSLLVRAWDLSHAAPAQSAVHRWLCEVEQLKQAPAVFHCALLTGPQGERLEKRTRGVTLPEILNRGYSIDRLLALFEASFDRKVAVPRGPAEMGGESAHSLKLTQTDGALSIN
jgi:glutamyl-tRNA synthetase